MAWCPDCREELPDETGPYMNHIGAHLLDAIPSRQPTAVEMALNVADISARTGLSVPQVIELFRESLRGIMETGLFTDR